MESCLTGDCGDLFKEVKALRRTKPSVAASIDGVNENVADYLKDIYSQLYNSVDEKQDLADLKIDIEKK